MSDRYTTFQISEAFWPSIYEGYTFNVNERPTFGLSIKAEELPNDLRPFARMSDKDGVSMVGLRSKIAPRVVVEGGDGTTTFQCARDANLRLDLLFTRAPLELAVEHVTFESNGYRGHARGETVNMLALVAVKVKIDDLIRRYDELCAKYFTGA